MFSTGIRRKNRSSRRRRAVSRQQLAMTWLRSSSVGIRRTVCSFTMSSNPFAPVSCHRNWHWRSHGNLRGNTCRGIRPSSAFTRIGNTSTPISYSIPSINLPAKNTTVTRKATISRSAASQTGSAGSMACPLSWRESLSKPSAMWSGCGGLRASRPFAPCWNRICGRPSRTPTISDTSSCSWNTWDMRSTTVIGWVFACGDRSDSSIPADATRCSRRMVSVLLFKEILRKLKQAAVPPCSHGLSIGHTKRIRNIPVSLPSMCIISICWVRSGSGSTRPA